MQILFKDQTKYLRRRLEDVVQLKQCLLDREFEMVYNVAHKMKGNGKTFNYPEIGSFGCCLEQAACTKNEIEIAFLIGKLTSYIENKLSNIDFKNID